MLDETVRAKPNQAYDYAAPFSQIAASASKSASTDWRSPGQTLIFAGVQTRQRR